MTTKALLGVTGVIELATGALLLAVPSLTATLLLGGGLGSPEAFVVGRISGAGLLAIGVICWMSRNHGRDGQNGLLAGLLVYNAAVAVVLGYAAVVGTVRGVGLWPAIGLHSVLLIWCAACLRRDE